MDHRTALEHAARMRREHPDRLTHTWMARGGPDGTWEVVKVRIPAGRRGAPEPPAPPQPDPQAPPAGAA